MAETTSRRAGLNLNHPLTRSPITTRLTVPILLLVSLACGCSQSSTPSAKKSAPGQPAQAQAGQQALIDYVVSLLKDPVRNEATYRLATEKLNQYIRETGGVEPPDPVGLAVLRKIMLSEPQQAEVFRSEFDLA